jgi:hypothetical protein
MNLQDKYTYTDAKGKITIIDKRSCMKQEPLPADWWSETGLKLNQKLTFGKHKGLPLQLVIRDFPDYVCWALENISWFTVNKEAFDYLQGIYDPRACFDGSINEVPG